ncbi:extracellular solute-binding protein [Duganella sp. FT135W]|uniref:Putrescine-binding periplasmic protein n=2 Tax=Duganella flavida TaxID=2692175 RepID=A0A6L8K621_9BURK|nr:polyamine ABC transporter substrate-binding protein [Duganella flavida]MYM21598.1 extracellular solute-binding protein [Duganella flavida]
MAALAMTGVARAEEEKVLNIYNWAEYIAPEVITNFEKETGIKVRYDIFDTNEVLHAKLVGGKTGYDIVVPSSTWAKMQISGGLMQKVDKGLLPNLKNLDPVIQAQMAQVDPGNNYLVSWLWGFTTVGINVDKVKAALGNTPMPDNAWDLVFKPEYASKLKSCGISILDSASELFPAALHAMDKNPYSKNLADYQEAFTQLQKIRPYVTLFSTTGYINDMANGSICVAVGWSGDFNVARQRAIDNKTGQHIEALIPRNGGILTFESMAIPADAPHPHNAHLWMNYILRPEVHAAITNKVLYANANKESLKFVKPQLVQNKTVFLDAEDTKRMIAPDSVGADVRRTVTRLYTKFKTGI